MRTIAGLIGIVVSGWLLLDGLGTLSAQGGFEQLGLKRAVHDGCLSPGEARVVLAALIFLVSFWCIAADAGRPRRPST